MDREERENLEAFEKGQLKRSKKVTGQINPVKERSAAKVKSHAFFGMDKRPEGTVLEELGNLRKPRHDIAQ